MPSTPTRKPPLQKRASLMPEQDTDLQATNPPTRGWGTGSYDSWGRPMQQTAMTRKRAIYGDPGASVDSCGHHTTDDLSGSVRGSKPGRW
jgi:hypothetical protein